MSSFESDILAYRTTLPCTNPPGGKTIVLANGAIRGEVITDPGEVRPIFPFDGGSLEAVVFPQAINLVLDVSIGGLTSIDSYKIRLGAVRVAFQIADPVKLLETIVGANKRYTKLQLVAVLVPMFRNSLISELGKKDINELMKQDLTRVFSAAFEHHLCGPTSETSWCDRCGLKFVGVDSYGYLAIEGDHQVGSLTSDIPHSWTMVDSAVDLVGTRTTPHSHGKGSPPAKQPQPQAYEFASRLCLNGDRLFFGVDCWQDDRATGQVWSFTMDEWPNATIYALPDPIAHDTPLYVLGQTLLYLDTMGRIGALECDSGLALAQQLDLKQRMGEQNPIMVQNTFRRGALDARLRKLFLAGKGPQEITIAYGPNGMPDLQSVPEIASVPRHPQCGPIVVHQGAVFWGDYLGQLYWMDTIGGVRFSGSSLDPLPCLRAEIRAAPVVWTDKSNALNVLYIDSLGNAVVLSYPSGMIISRFRVTSIQSIIGAWKPAQDSTFVLNGWSPHATDRRVVAVISVPTTKAKVWERRKFKTSDATTIKPVWTQSAASEDPVYVVVQHDKAYIWSANKLFVMGGNGELSEQSYPWRVSSQPVYCDDYWYLPLRDSVLRIRGDML